MAAMVAISAIERCLFEKGLKDLEPLNDASIHSTTTKSIPKIEPSANCFDTDLSINSLHEKYPIDQ